MGTSVYVREGHWWENHASKRESLGFIMLLRGTRQGPTTLYSRCRITTATQAEYYPE